MIFVTLQFQLKDHGQVGGFGGHVQPVVDKDPGLGIALTVMGYHALEAIQI